MKTTYNLLKKDIRNSELVKNSVLGSIDEWKRSHYVILSEIIRESLAKAEVLQGDKKHEIGTTISHVTLQRFFESDYQDKTHNDLRFLKTLDKICIFLGFENLNDYIKSGRPDQSDETATQQEFCEFSVDIIYKYCQAEFNYLSNLSNPDPSEMLQYVFEDSPLFERVISYLELQSAQGFRMVTANNRSNYELFDINLITDEKKQKVLRTQEFWNLLLHNEQTGQDYHVNRINTQFYFIKKINGVWKIWDNYNPNAGELFDSSKK